MEDVKPFKETKKQKQRDRRAVKKVKIVGPAVYVGDKVVAGGINQEFSIKKVSEHAIANAQRECVLFSGKLLSLMAQNGETKEPPMQIIQEVGFSGDKTNKEGDVSA